MTSEQEVRAINTFANAIAYIVAAAAIVWGVLLIVSALEGAEHEFFTAVEAVRVLLVGEVNVLAGWIIAFAIYKRWVWG